MGAAVHIKAAMLYKGISQINFAESVGKIPQTFYNQLNRDAFKWKDVEYLADKLGCDVVLVDRETGQIY